MGAIKYINVDGLNNELIATYDSENNIITETYAAKTDVTVTVAADLSNLIIWRGTQSEYNALSEYDDNTLYIVTADIPYEPIAGDVVFYDNVTESKVVVPADNVNIDDYPADRYTPIGVVVIPPSHDVYGTGEGAMISLKEMNYTTPDEGSVNHLFICYGQYGTQIFETDFSNVVICNNTASATRFDSYGLLPSDEFNYALCVTDSLAFYSDRFYSDNFLTPSPYLENGLRNSVYYQVSSPSSALNRLADFNGIENTKTLCDLATAQSDWKTNEIITNIGDTGYSPAACCCWRYHTAGTKSGDWYLPSCGELGYMIVRHKRINLTLLQLYKIYGEFISCLIDENELYLSSTETSKNNANNMNPYDGHVGNQKKNLDSAFYARAFSRIGGGGSEGSSSGDSYEFTFISVTYTSSAGTNLYTISVNVNPALNDDYLLMMVGDDFSGCDYGKESNLQVIFSGVLEDDLLNGIQFVVFDNITLSEIFVTPYTIYLEYTPDLNNQSIHLSYRYEDGTTKRVY